MYVGKIIGNVVATRKDESLVGKKLLVVEQTDTQGKSLGKIEVAIDSVGAGKGEYVLVAKGSSARHVFNSPQSPIDAAIVGIIDSIEVSE